MATTATTPTTPNFSIESTTVYVVACGAAKLDHAAPAADLYTGSHFQWVLWKALELADGNAERVRILSARHGLLRLDDVVEPYDAKMGDGDVLFVEELADQLADLWLDTEGMRLRLVALTPKAYTEVLAKAVGIAPGLVNLWRPLAGSRGIGEQRGRIAELVRQHQAPAEATPEPPDMRNLDHPKWGGAAPLGWRGLIACDTGALRVPGDIIFNYYDGEWGVVTDAPMSLEPATCRCHNHRPAWWDLDGPGEQRVRAHTVWARIGTRNGNHVTLDGSRIASPGQVLREIEAGNPHFGLDKVHERWLQFLAAPTVEPAHAQEVAWIERHLVELAQQAEAASRPR